MIGNFPPRRCGIATFTRDIFESLRQAAPKAVWDVVAMDDGKSQITYPPTVTHVVPQDDPDSYVRTAQSLNRSGAEIAFIQHEYGIFGGEAGGHLLLLMRRLRMPVVVTLHTVLERPSPAQKRVMDEILALSSSAIVMSEMGKRIIARVHPSAARKVHVIPHGAPSRPFGSTEPFKAALGYDGRKTIMTFGLLSPNKGIETVVRALPRILERHSDVLYLIVGATHPHLIQREGEAYRNRIVELATELGVVDHIAFVNRYLGDAELIDLLQATDIYATPYLTEAQITSGTLSYAIALGRPIVSTPYWHAREALANGVGVLCGFNDAEAFARALEDLLSNPVRRQAMARRAYAVGEASRWTSIARSVVELAVAARPLDARTPASMIETFASPSLLAVERMFDDCGMFQHAACRIPDRRHGYCTDDNARALNLLVRLGQEGDDADPDLRLTYAAAAFIGHAWNPETGRFRNFMSYERRWLDDGGSGDCCARAFEALCLTARDAASPDLRDWAVDLARQAACHSANWTSLRATAGVIKAASVGSESALSPDEARRIVATGASTLMAKLPRHEGGAGWFEPALSYDNARLPEALILAGDMLGDAAMLEAGIAALSHLMDCQTSPHDWFRPCATSCFAETGADHPAFDQQPIEALATVEACLAAWRVTGDDRWAQQAERAYLWFAGDNDHALALASPHDGGCHDGLTAEGLNRNQGAESILSYHLASASLRALLRERHARH